LFQYQLPLLIVSIVVAVFSAFLSLVIFEKSLASGEKKLIWVGFAGLAFGFGIWTMHFIAILAIDMDFSIRYEWKLTLLSFIVPSITSFLSFFALLKLIHEKNKLYIPALLFSLGIIGMHHIGIEAIQFDGRILWEVSYFLISYVITFIISYIWLYLFYRTKNSRSKRFVNKWSISFLMGISIPIMHFISMEGIEFVPSIVMPYLIHNSPSNMTIMTLVVILTGIVLFLGLLFFVNERNIYIRASKRAEQKYQSLFDHNPDAVFTFDTEGKFISINPAGEDLSGYRKEELIGTSFLPLISDGDRSERFIPLASH
jgi:NO-binding membrane sensor protein with MHYT domain